MKCDVCDEEFDSENQLMQHKAQMHAGGTGAVEGEPARMVDAREGMMPRPENEMTDSGAREPATREQAQMGAEQGGMEGKDEGDLEEPDYPRAANE